MYRVRKPVIYLLQTIVDCAWGGHRGGWIWLWPTSDMSSWGMNPYLVLIMNEWGSVDCLKSSSRKPIKLYILSPLSPLDAGVDAAWYRGSLQNTFLQLARAEIPIQRLQGLVATMPWRLAATIKYSMRRGNAKNWISHAMSMAWKYQYYCSAFRIVLVKVTGRHFATHLNICDFNKITLYCTSLWKNVRVISH